MNQQVTQYIQQAPEDQKKIMEEIRSLIHEAVTNTEESFKWSRPVFSSGKDFAYLKTAKNYVTLGFFSSEGLEDPDGLLEGSGKDMRHIKIKKPGDINKKLLQKWLKTLGRK